MELLAEFLGITLTPFSTVAGYIRIQHSLHRAVHTAMRKLSSGLS